ncbi:MAG: hypothetical protein R3E79_61040 [Caldilineaceae bacterium]
MLDTLAGFGYALHDRIRHLTVLTPVDLAQRTGAWRGALYGLSSNQLWNAFRRPHNRATGTRPLLCRRHDPPRRRMCRLWSPCRVRW